jgi:hypothetical protein
MEYILYKDKKNQGPYTISQLKEMAKYNLIEPEDYVWTETWSKWRKISTISQINFSANDQVAMTSKENKESYRLERPPQELDRKYELFESIAMVQNTTEQQRAWSS